MRKTYSLRRQLLLWISVPILLATLLALLIGYFFARYEIEEVYDAQLVHAAKVLLQLTQHEIMEDIADKNFVLGTENRDLQHKYETNLGFRIWARDRLISQSPSTKGFGGVEAPFGFSNQHVGQYEWRVFVFFDPEHDIKVEVSERYDIRYELIIQLMASLFLPALLFLPMILLIVWIGVRKALKPVVKISSDVDVRNSNNLSPISKDYLPEEIAPFIQALNRLFARIEESFKRERHFTDNAAHELRTPLAAMKTQTQVLLKRAGAMPDCKADLDNLHASINRASHMVDQLLSFSRLQGDEVVFEKVDLSSFAADILQDISPLAAKRDIDLRVNIAQDISVKGSRPALQILLRNLIDNAIKFTPSGGKVEMAISEEEHKALIQVSDTGQGVEDSEKEKVFERFYRVQKNKQGSGLGLSMAQWVCDVHGAEISLKDNHPRGLIVTVTMERY